MSVDLRKDSESYGKWYGVILSDEVRIRWDDSNIGIEWPLDRVNEIIISKKDKNFLELWDK